ncbi:MULTISPECIES: Arc family DNA-binding protein [Paraburkholderia]|uniref:Arc family DNA-binding protein n=1 Tax=Paraburkholderia TaxID=1822464 RepID=UPI0022549858|nr:MULTISPECIES: Arc family DNA-binding protein [Paraburkholderia]MCX4156175.1 Arc family DNA-binding protein [Paraburkholderia aspalathi]MDN7165581.1 Arc family DNA-binding protein [Paraburkholderia sp. SECH2]MDQ6394067.1 Arc family DNA-binding protein [Paraburkholderia aspalathi]
MSSEKATPKQAAAYPIRMPPELRQELQQRADAAGRSLNQEIVDRLEKSVGPPPKIPKGLQQIVEAATAGTDESLEEAAVRLVVLGIQSQAHRKSAESAAAAERYRSVALQQLLASTNDRLGELLRYLASVRGIDPERVAAASRHKEAMSRHLGQLDLFGTPGLSSIVRDMK